jgi:DNA invertase Pin-like site-specific DNA recombinase
MEGRFVVYYRVSTSGQGKSGLGLEAQKETVMRFLNGGKHEIVGEYTEIESGGKDNRPELQKAFLDCRLKKAKLIVSKLDRLSRDVHFISGLQKAGIRFVVAEQPEMNELTVHLLAAIGQHERTLISQRTKDALQAAKVRGKRLGSPYIIKGERIPNSGDTSQANKARSFKADDYALAIAPIIQEYQTSGSFSLRNLAEKLNSAGYMTPRQKKWQATSVQRLLNRIAQNCCKNNEMH